jgi:UDP-2,3-diacylglucosamine pyrophosphatase LpxH
VKGAVNFISAFEQAVAADAARHGVDAVMCGHIHQPVIRRIGAIQYLNTGDWVESCSAILEHLDGSLELVRWKLGAELRDPSPRLVLEPAA